ncbi:hypothetical protein DT075_39830 [Bacillus licheniformis]|nr:hypothetical protein DT075_39830 [Bacillus licheniformis]
MLGKPSVLTKAGKIFASAFSDREIDVVMTVATKGIPLAYAVASYLDVPRPLTFFSERYQSAKSSISEDLTIIKQTFEQQGIGTLQTVPGAAGGVKYIPKVKRDEAEEFVKSLGE